MLISGMIAIFLHNERHFSARRLLSIAMLAALVLSACAPYQARRHPIDYRAVGEASWYGPGFHGRKTANGEKYNQRALTAAHPTLPLGTSVKVTNLENDKSVVVRINDRGPFVRGRIIDLSKGAAEKLGIVGAGTAEVAIDAISVPVKRTDFAVALASKRPKGGHEVPSEVEDAADDDFDSGDVATDKSGVAALIAKEPKEDREEYPQEGDGPPRVNSKKKAAASAPAKRDPSKSAGDEF